MAKETSDWVIVAEPSKEHVGLKPDEQVVTNGSLILEQMYEDRLTRRGRDFRRSGPLDDEAFGKPDKPVSIIEPLNRSRESAAFLGVSLLLPEYAMSLFDPPPVARFPPVRAGPFADEWTKRS